MSWPAFLPRMLWYINKSNNLSALADAQVSPVSCEVFQVLCESDGKLAAHWLGGEDHKGSSLSVDQLTL